MKHLLLLLSILILLPFGFTSCKKDDEKPVTQTIDQSILGSWNLNTLKDEYYNSAGTKVYEESRTSDISKVVFEKTTGTLYLSGGLANQNFNYTITKSFGNNVLNLNYNNVQIGEFILALSDKNKMILFTVGAGKITYTENGVTKEASNYKRFYEFTR